MRPDVKVKRFRQETRYAHNRSEGTAPRARQEKRDRKVRDRGNLPTTR